MQFWRSLSGQADAPPQAQPEAVRGVETVAKVFGLLPAKAPSEEEMLAQFTKFGKAPKPRSVPESTGHAELPGPVKEDLRSRADAYRDYLRQASRLQTRQAARALHWRFTAARDLRQTQKRLNLSRINAEALEVRARQFRTAGDLPPSSLEEVADATILARALHDGVRDLIERGKAIDMQTSEVVYSDGSEAGATRHRSGLLNAIARGLQAEDPVEQSAVDDDARVREADDQLLAQEQRLKLEDSALQGELIKVRAVQAEVVRKLMVVQQQRSTSSRDDVKKSSSIPAVALAVLPSMLRHCADELSANSGSIGSGLGDSWAEEEAGLFSVLLPSAAERGAGSGNHLSDGPQPLVVSPPPPPSWVPSPGVEATWKVEAEDRAVLGKLAGRIEDLRRSFQEADREPGEDSASARSTETSRSQSTAAASLMASLVPATASSWSSSRQIGSSPSAVGDGGSDHALSRFAATAAGPGAGSVAPALPSAEKEELQLLAQQLTQQNEALQRELHAEELSSKLCESQVDASLSPHQRLHDELAQERRYEQQLAEAVASARALVVGDPGEEERLLQSLRTELAQTYTVLAAVLAAQPNAGQLPPPLAEGATLTRVAALRKECEDLEAENAMLRSAAPQTVATASASPGREPRSIHPQFAAPAPPVTVAPPAAVSSASGAPMYARLQDGRQVELTSRVHRQEQEIAELRERIRSVEQRTSGQRRPSAPQVATSVAAGTSSLPPTAFVPLGSSSPSGRSTWAAGRSVGIA